MHDMMKQMSFCSMFLLGFLGTGHCIGMCGPIVLALPARAGNLAAHLLYHSGRVLTYAVIGLILGGIGSGFVDLTGTTEGFYLDRLARLQLMFSALASLFMLFFGLSRLGLIKEPAWMSAASPAKIPGFSKVQHEVFARKKTSAYFLFGLMLGFLPCGLSYAAFAMALPAGGAQEGGLLVLAFGLGTVPGLVLVGSGATALFRRYRKASELLSGLLMIGMSILLAGKAYVSFYYAV
jgi:sulfite exporter TauE/SafE